MASLLLLQARGVLCTTIVATKKDEEVYRMNWIISANHNKFDHSAAFDKFGYIDWKKSSNFKTGDIVYIYCTNPIKEIRFKTVVTIDIMDFSQTTNNEEFWKDKKEYFSAQSGKYFRLQLLLSISNHDLSLENLKLNGLHGAPQGPQKLNNKTVIYIEKFFNAKTIPITSDDASFVEGMYALREHIFRERNQELIKKAKLRFKGKHNGKLFCEVCGFNFSEKYGQLGEDFIEAHHIKPVSEMKDGEETNIEDIIMLCSNCHSMIHRKRPWLTKDKLKELLK